LDFKKANNVKKVIDKYCHFPYNVLAQLGKEGRKMVKKITVMYDVYHNVCNIMVDGVYWEKLDAMDADIAITCAEIEFDIMETYNFDKSGIKNQDIIADIERQATMLSKANFPDAEIVFETFSPCL